MQRRAATAYVVLLLVVAAGSYAVIAGADSPEVTVGGPAETHANQSSFAVDGRSYTVVDVRAEVTEGDALVREADLAWVNDSARYTATIENGSTLTLGGTDYRVTVPNVSSPSEATLTEIQRTNLPNTTVNGTTYVVLDADGDNRTLIPEDRYLRDTFGAPDERTLSVGDRLDLRGNDTRVVDVSTDGVTVAWQAPRRNVVTVSQGSNVTLNGVRHVAHFEDNESVVLTTDVDAYVSQSADVDRFHERINGFWGVVILTVLAAALLAGLAFLPTKDI